MSKRDRSRGVGLQVLSCGKSSGIILLRMLKLIARLILLSLPTLPVNLHPEQLRFSKHLLENISQSSSTFCLKPLLDDSDAGYYYVCSSFTCSLLGAHDFTNFCFGLLFRLHNKLTHTQHIWARLKSTTVWKSSLEESFMLDFIFVSSSSSKFTHNHVHKRVLSCMVRSFICLSLLHVFAWFVLASSFSIFVLLLLKLLLRFY